jgi:hypothetical protein
LFLERESPDGKEVYRWVYVNPYTAKALGYHDFDTEFFNVVLKIHRTLFAGEWGRWIVEGMTSWSIVSIITGLYLWWPHVLGCLATPAENFHSAPSPRPPHGSGALSFALCRAHFADRVVFHRDLGNRATFVPGVV